MEAHNGESNLSNVPLPRQAKRENGKSSGPGFPLHRGPSCLANNLSPYAPPGEHPMLASRSQDAGLLELRKDLTQRPAIPSYRRTDKGRRTLTPLPCPVFSSNPPASRLLPAAQQLASSPRSSCRRESSPLPVPSPAPQGPPPHRSPFSSFAALSLNGKDNWLDGSSLAFCCSEKGFWDFRISPDERRWRGYSCHLLQEAISFWLLKSDCTWGTELPFFPGSSISRIDKKKQKQNNK